MKHILYLLVAVWVLPVTAQDNPVAYLNDLAADYDQINKDTWDYLKVATRGRNASRVEKRRQELVVTLRKAKYNVTQVPSFKGDRSLKDAYRDYLALSYEVISNGFSRIVNMEKVAEESYDAMEAYLMTKELANKKMDSAFQMLDSVQDVFITRYNVPIREKQSRTSIKLDNYGRINEYYNDVYLIFFKSTFYESEMLDAMAVEKIGDMEQFRQTLERVSKEGMDELKRVGDYRDNKVLSTACHRMLEFYYGEAVRYMPKLIEFYEIKDRFEVSTKNMESKSKRDITRQEAQEYNTSINQYNQAIQEFNETNEYLNKHRSIRYEEFVKAVDDYYQEYL